MIELSPEQMQMLREILTGYLSDLRMEIADTDSMDFREALKRRREFVGGARRPARPGAASPTLTGPSGTRIA